MARTKAGAGRSISAGRSHRGWWPIRFGHRLRPEALQVTNVLIIDKAEEGKEGPWLSYARMHTLRSPKDFTGPDLDTPSLTYQSWHEARFGKESWQALDFDSRQLWVEYLAWFKRAVSFKDT